MLEFENGFPNLLIVVPIIIEMTIFYVKPKLSIYQNYEIFTYGKIVMDDGRITMMYSNKSVGHKTYFQ